MKAQNIALYAAMATVIAGVLIFMSGNNIGSIVLGIGALVMFGIRGYNRAVCHDKAIMRLYTIQVFGSIMLMGAAWLMYSGRHYWIIPLLICAAVELYVSFRNK